MAQPTNIGKFERDDFTAITELGVSLRRELRCGLDFTMGYSLVYWGEVARAGEKIDFDLNLSQVPPDELMGAPFPQFSFLTSGFWVQGLSIGPEYSF